MFEHYFSEKVNDFTWRNFSIAESNGRVNEEYQRIEGYGWKSKFVLNPNGQALYINRDKIYEGVWFEIGERKITVFKK